jgi:hypothetical protein
MESEIDPIDPFDKIALDILYDMWYTVAEKIFQRITEVVDLTPEQLDAIKSTTLRPNLFQVEIE